MRNLVLALALTLPPGARAASPCPEGYSSQRVATGTLCARGATAADVEWVESYLPRALEAAEERLGRRLEGDFMTILVSSPRELARLVRLYGGGPVEDYTLGVAFPSRKLMLVRGDLAAWHRPDDSPAATIVHEVAHLVLHRKHSTRLPRWLDEGLAMWAAGQNLAAEDTAYLALNARTGNLYKLDTLERAFPRGHLPTSIAYQQSFSLVMFLAARHGESGIHRLLDRLEDGESVWPALERLTGLSREAFEKSFAEWLGARYSLLEIIVHLASIWTIIGLLALVAIGRYVYKRRRLLRDLDDGELDEKEPRSSSEI